MASGARQPPQGKFRVCAAYHRAVELIGRRWNGAIIEALMGGPRRFCEIRAAVPGLKDPQLARRLRELEQQGILERRVHPSRPVKVQYALTPKGEDLRSVVTEVHRWAQRWLGSPPGGEGSAAEAAEPPKGRRGQGRAGPAGAGPEGRKGGASARKPAALRNPSAR